MAKTKKTLDQEANKKTILTSWLKKFRAPIIIVLLQSIVLYLQNARIGGDDPIRLGSVSELASNHWPAMKFSIIHPEFFALPYKLINSLGLDGRWIIDHNGAVLWLIWSLIMMVVIGRYRSPKYTITAITITYCSMLAPYLLGFNTEAFSALGISVGLALGLLGHSRFAKMSGWILLVFATGNIPITIISASAVSLFLIIKHKRLRYMLYPALTLVIIILEATHQKGYLSFSKYVLNNEVGSYGILPWEPVRAFGYPIFFGVIAILFSFGRGLFFYIPTLITGFRKINDKVGEWIVVQLLFLLCLVPIYGAWWAWYGGLSFGPRFFLLGCVIGAFGATEILLSKKTGVLSRFLTLLAVCWSGWVAIVGVSYFITPKVAFMCMKDGFRFESLCWYSPEYSTLFAPFWEGGSVNWQAKLFTFTIVGCLVYVLYSPAIDLFKFGYNKTRYFIKHIYNTSWVW